MKRDFLACSIAITSFVSGIVFFCLVSIFFESRSIDIYYIVKSFQTILAAIIAFIAALIAFTGVMRQINANNKNHEKTILLQSLQHQYAVYQKNYGVAACISGDIHGLITRVENLKYLESFCQQKEMLQNSEITEVISLSIKGDYFSVFNGLSAEIGILNAPLPKEICEWYVWARGFLDTVNAALDGYYKNGDQIELVQTLIDDIEGLSKKGKKIVQDLDAYADKNHSLSSGIRNTIDSIIRTNGST